MDRDCVRFCRVVCRHVFVDRGYAAALCVCTWCDDCGPSAERREGVGSRVTVLIAACQAACQVYYGPLLCSTYSYCMCVHPSPTKPPTKITTQPPTNTQVGPEVARQVFDEHIERLKAKELKDKDRDKDRDRDRKHSSRGGDSDDEGAGSKKKKRSSRCGCGWGVVFLGCRVVSLAALSGQVCAQSRAA